MYVMHQKHKLGLISYITQLLRSNGMIVQQSRLRCRTIVDGKLLLSLSVYIGISNIPPLLQVLHCVVVRVVSECRATQ